MDTVVGVVGGTEDIKVLVVITGVEALPDEQAAVKMKIRAIICTRLTMQLSYQIILGCVLAYCNNRPNNTPNAPQAKLTQSLFSHFHPRM